MCQPRRLTINVRLARWFFWIEVIAAAFTVLCAHLYWVLQHLACLVLTSIGGGVMLGAFIRDRLSRLSAPEIYELIQRHCWTKPAPEEGGEE